ncbi:MAG: GMC family oxidoreductase, partial [Vicinamibacterales bacterium]
MQASSSPRRPAFDHYDVIIIGSGAGGGTLAHGLADSGARILVLERGDFVPEEAQNWDPAAVWKDLRYRTTERWLDQHGERFQPYTHYNVGGNTKFWGSVLYRFRPTDFDEVQHADGVSPAWPITYDTLAPYYDRAEQLYQVHGKAGDDPTDPPRGPFPYAPIPHASNMSAIVEQLRGMGLHPSALPLGLIGPGAPGGCVLCNTCNSFPCRIRRKSDAEVCAVNPAVERGRVELFTGVYAKHLLTNDAGTRVEAVDVDVDGSTCTLRAPLIVVSCGAVNSAALLLRSANAAHPR